VVGILLPLFYMTGCDSNRPRPIQPKITGRYKVIIPDDANSDNPLTPYLVESVQYLNTDKTVIQFKFNGKTFTTNNFVIVDTTPEKDAN
jgi:hypothetical protein